MAVHSILPKENLTGDDIRDTLNANGGRVTNDCTTFFSVGAGVWKWSRWKPIIHTEPFNLTDAMLVASQFGLTTPAGSNDPVTAASGEYVYKLPAGNAAQPWRLNDFRNYNPKALPPCSSAGNYTVNGNLTTKTFILPINLNGDATSIGGNELKDIRNCYLALAIRYTYGGTTYVTYKTDSQTIGSTGGTGVTFNLATDLPFSLNTVNTMTYYWLAAEYAKTGTNEPSQQRFYALPFGKASDCSGTITATGGGIDLQFTATGIMSYLEEAYVDDIKLYQKEDAPRYFRMSNSGTVYLEYTVKNSNSVAKSVNLGGGSTGAKSTGTARPSFAKNQPAPTTGAVPVQWYQKSGSTWKQVTSVTVAANSSIQLRVGTDGWLAYKNGVSNLCAEGLQELTSVSVKLPDSTLSALMVYLRS